MPSENAEGMGELPAVFGCAVDDVRCVEPFIGLDDEPAVAAWCREQRLKRNGGSVIEGETFPIHYTVTIQPSDLGFRSIGCSPWTKVG